MLATKRRRIYMSLKKRANKSIAIALVGITLSTPFLSNVSAMEKKKL